MAMTLAELPFVERPAIELLDLERDEPDPDYAGFGWTRVGRLWLASEEKERAPREIINALVIGAHARDDAPGYDDDIELSFELSPEHAVVTMLSDFLDTWLPKLPQDVPAIVLAICNPHGARLARPATAPWKVPVYHGIGDVTAWLDLDERDRPLRIRLSAAWWRTLSG